MIKLIFKIAAFFLALAASPAIAAEPLHVVTSFSVLQDLAQQVGGAHIRAISLVGPDSDAHAYTPTPQDIKTLKAADLIIINGLHFEPWAERIIKAEGLSSRVLVASSAIEPLALEEEGQHVEDPHAWQNIANAQSYVAQIAKAFAERDPTNKADYEKSAASYLAKLQRLENNLKEQLAFIPPEKRKIITSHDAFGYFGAAYGITFLAPQGLSSEDEPSAAALARLITQIKHENITTLFVENALPSRFMAQLAKDTGIQMGGRLYADTLSGPSGEAPTYLDMMHHNIGLFLKALKNGV